MKLKNIIMYSFLFLSIAGWGPFSFLSSSSSNDAVLSTTSPTGSSSWINSEVNILHNQASNLNPTVLKLALKAYVKGRSEGLDRKQFLTIIDYSKPSTERRMWVINLHNNNVLYNTWVSHGRGSGDLNATSFSNAAGSLKSSIGVFVTDTPYFGHEGYSLRLSGLERNINDNAYRRAIVIHGAWYVDPGVGHQYGRLGRSWGCPAVSPQLAKPIIDKIKDNTLVFAYYPDSHWLHTSTFLNA